MRTIKGLLTKTLKIIKSKIIPFSIPHFIQLKKQKKIAVLNEEEVQQLDKIHRINNIQEVTCSINNRTTRHRSTEMANSVISKGIMLNKTHSTWARHETQLLTIQCNCQVVVVTRKMSLFSVLNLGRRKWLWSKRREQIQLYRLKWGLKARGTVSRLIKTKDKTYWGIKYIKLKITYKTAQHKIWICQLKCSQATCKEWWTMLTVRLHRQVIHNSRLLSITSSTYRNNKTI